MIQSWRRAINLMQNVVPAGRVLLGIYAEKFLVFLSEKEPKMCAQHHQRQEKARTTPYLHTCRSNDL